MGIIKRRNAYEVSVYDPSVKAKRYVGRREMLKDAKALFAEKTKEFQKQEPKPALSVSEYANEWLELHHGKGTRRPARTTRQVNETNLRRFLEVYGDRSIDGGIARREALAWSKPIPHVAKTVAAMFNDAVDDEVAKSNPFANRRQSRSRERKDIAPITETELDTLAQIALDHWGADGYGQIARAWVLFAAWVGCRPGETFTTPLTSLASGQGLVKIRRVKKRGSEGYPTDTVVLPQAAADAVRDAEHRLAHAGPMFRTVTGREMRENLSWHWDPIRDKFQMTVDKDRWEELLGGQPQFDFYSLRHFCASIMVDRGGNEFDGSAQLGNSPQVFRDTYMHDYKDRVLERNRRLLDRPTVVELRGIRGA